MPTGGIGEAALVMGGAQAVGGLLGAQATGAAGRAQLGQQQADRAAAAAYAEPTPEELANLQQMIKFSEGDIQRKTKLLESADPALIEAGKQALALLQGQEAATLAPLKNNIAKQEQKLRERLQAQLGTGYENSTAGIQALQAFNEQASSALAGAQQQSLGSLLGVTQNVRGMAGNLNTQLQLGEALGNIQKRKIGAITGSPIDPGLAYSGDMSMGRAIGGIGTNIGQGMLLGNLLGSSPTAGKLAPTASMLQPTGEMSILPYRGVQS